MAPRLNKTRIFEHFNVKEDDNIAICNICNSSLKTNRLFNLKNHLSNVHKVNISDDETSSSSGSGIAKTGFRKQSVKIEISKKELIKSYIELVTEESIPFNVLDSKSMKNIIDPICRGLSEKSNKPFTLNSRSCKSVLKQVANNTREEVKKELNKRLISLKIDSASRLSRTMYVCITKYKFF